MLAELDVYHSRPIAPTRRLALGRRTLPLDPAPGVGQLLLGAIVARHIRDIDPDDWADLTRLTHQVERGYRIAQPRLRHRLQDDRIGLTRSRHCAQANGTALHFTHDDASGRPIQQVLGAVYAAGDFDFDARRSAMAIVRRAMRWIGEPDDIDRLVAHLSGDENAFSLPAGAEGDPVYWAMQVLGFVDGPESLESPEREIVVKRFRTLLLDAHPDQGGESTDAAVRIAELSEARRILLR